MFGNFQFIMIFDNFLLPNQSLLAHCYKYYPQTKIQQYIDFPMEISVIKFHAWQFDENPAFQD